MQIAELLTYPNVAKILRVEVSGTLLAISPVFVFYDKEYLKVAKFLYIYICICSVLSTAWN